jgi:hypothetical protein
MGSIFDLIAQSSSISLGELDARAPGDSGATAAELSQLLKQGFIQLHLPHDKVELTKDNSVESFRSILSSPDRTLANSVFVTATSSGFKSTS